ncbi:hypothetical protein E2562_033993 [Oryza meyeriana var. granulata]|uniref:Uncharacterized protein n=1 Tax=Oryza meyeriana var. granulata TaxID=110450 RepID=A0A6G1ESC4_9ORYZ|nr:hypothetical protein E2562_033993 [Oryza meyeriana var. granulata]
MDFSGGVGDRAETVQKGASLIGCKRFTKRAMEVGPLLKPAPCRPSPAPSASSPPAPKPCSPSSAPTVASAEQRNHLRMPSTAPSLSL